jgi:CO dehydrogenase/acetyl-CoA synthase gamma subunit (corrinoid Fe-S protein)
MFRKLMIALFRLGVLIPPSSPGHAAPVCGERATLANTLEVRYAEILAFAALTDDGKLMEVFTSRTGTFTVIVTSPQSPSCVVATGSAWEGIHNIKTTPTA